MPHPSRVQNDPENPSRNRRGKFVEMAEARMNKVLFDMDHLGQLSDRSRYHYTDEEWWAMRGRLHDMLDQLDEWFTVGQGKRPRFKFEFDPNRHFSLSTEKGV